MSDGKPIIIIKKKGGHGGHHGGAWKVAYADFVTAMMAFFMVMWLVNSADSVTKKSVASYFRKPGLFEHGSGTPLLIGEAGILNDAYVPAKKEKKKEQSNFDDPSPLKKRSGAEDKELEKTKSSQRQKQMIMPSVTPTPSVEPTATPSGTPAQILMNIQPAPSVQPTPETTPTVSQGSQLGKQDKKFDGVAGEADPDDKRRKELRRIADRIRKELESTPGIKDLAGLVNFTMDGDGLRIDIADTENRSMFALGSASVLPDARELFAKVGTTLATIPYPIDIIGHTDGKPYSATRGGYSNWELSSDRANAARRLLEVSGVDNSRFGSVMGRADKELRNAGDPLDPTNRRISMKVRFPAPKTDLSMKSEAIPAAAKGIESATHEQLPASEEPTPEGSAITEPSPGTEQATPPPAGSDPSASASPVGGKGDYYKPKNKVSAREGKKRVTLDEEPEPSPEVTDRPIQKRDRLFGDIPVIGPQDIFSGM